MNLRKQMTTADDITEKAKDRFGVADHWRSGFYILRDGSILDGSGRKLGSRSGTRSSDHREIADVIDADSPTEAMIAFMRDGNIRLIPEVPGIDLIAKPTEEQYDALGRIMADCRGGHFAIDISDERGDVVDSFEYDGAGSAALADLRAYFAESLRESMSRQQMIAKLREWGKDYDFGRFSDAQIYNIYMKQREANKKREAELAARLANPPKTYRYCKNCGAMLNDAGECPVCDLGDMSALDEKIVRKGCRWQVQSEKGRNMGTYDTKAEAEKRLQQVHYFKYRNEGLAEDAKKLSGGKIIQLLKDFKNKVFTLSEPEVLEIFKNAVGSLTEKAPMFLTSNGTILNALTVNDDIYNATHLDMVSDAFCKDRDLNSPDQYTFTDNQANKYIDIVYDISLYAVDNLNWIKLNSGTALDNGEPYMLLPAHAISDQQRHVLNDFLWLLASKNKNRLEIEANDGEICLYYFDECDPDYILDRIDGYYRTGKLLEQRKLTEDTRTSLINGSRNKGDYKDRSRGKNRFERKKYSRIASAVKAYNQLDMNDLFKKDLLTVKVPVTGESGSYTVSIKMEGVIKELQNGIKNGGNRLEFKTVLQSLTKVFNTSNVYVNCTCPDYAFSFSHWNIVRNVSSDDSSHDPGAGKGIANPNDDKGRGCKHVLLVLSNGDWLMKVASCIKNYIFYAEEHMKPAFDKLIFPKLYNMTVDDAVANDLVPEGTDPEKDKHIIETANEWARNRGKIQKGSNKNPAAGKGKLQGPKEEADRKEGE